MKLVSAHKILKLKQSDWLKKYIDFNTDKRKNAANSSEKDFLVLKKIRLVNNVGDYKKYLSKPSFVSQKIFNKNFVAIHETSFST